MSAESCAPVVEHIHPNNFLHGRELVVIYMRRGLGKSLENVPVAISCIKNHCWMGMRRAAAENVNLRICYFLMETNSLI